MRKLTVKAPAKINFGLNIVSKRNDGFHNIETIFYPVNLHDILTFEQSHVFSFESNNEDLGKDEQNLIIKTVKLLEEFSHEKFNVEVHLEKNIPIGAGLGGGSSDSATTLLSLNEIFSLKLDDKKLGDLASKVGSDVPFFLNPETAHFGEGRGEKLSKIDFKIDKPILLVNPGIHISTKWAYENITPKKPVFNLKELNSGKMDFNEFKKIVQNDFEEIVFKKYPEIGGIKNQLDALGSEFSLMSGSGSTVFGIFRNIKEATLAKQHFQNRYFTFIHYEDN